MPLALSWFGPYDHGVPTPPLVLALHLFGEGELALAPAGFCLLIFVIHGCEFELVRCVICINIINSALLPSPRSTTELFFCHCSACLERTLIPRYWLRDPDRLQTFLFLRSLSWLCCHGCFRRAALSDTVKCLWSFLFTLWHFNNIHFVIITRHASTSYEWHCVVMVNCACVVCVSRLWILVMNVISVIRARDLRLPQQAAVHGIYVKVTQLTVL